MSDFSRTHAALFDELERQGIYCVDVGRLTRAAMETQTIIASSQSSARSVEVGSYQRCKVCE